MERLLLLFLTVMLSGCSFTIKVDKQRNEIQCYENADGDILCL